MASLTRHEPRVCVIGAGPCGLTAIKNLLAAGLRQIVCYDDSDAIGGNWVFRENTNRACVYECTHIISSKKMSEFDDFPMPAGYPDFPSHRQLVAYFESYAAHFGLCPYIQLKTQVEKAVRGDDGRWTLQLANTVKPEVFDHLLVCSGHHREPFTPDYPGRFTGEVLTRAPIAAPTTSGTGACWSLAPAIQPATSRPTSREWHG